jgi:RNA exonuclease 1
MFSSLGLFQSLPCPHKSDCKRSVCLFSHAHDLPQPPLIIATAAADPTPSVIASTSSPVASSSTPKPKPTIPAKRPFELSARSTRNVTVSEPPPQRLRITTSQKPVALPTQSQTTVRAFYLLSYLVLKVLIRGPHIDGCTRPQSQRSPIPGCSTRSSGSVVPSSSC